jgi:L-Ala-D/L-Glu epimerase
VARLAGAVDGINIKLAKCGSLREALRMIATARAHGLLVMVGCMIETSLGITAAAQFTSLVDAADLDGAALTTNDPFLGATIDGGQVRVPTGPGLGVRRR